MQSWVNIKYDMKIDKTLQLLIIMLENEKENKAKQKDEKQSERRNFKRAIREQLLITHHKSYDLSPPSHHIARQRITLTRMQKSLFLVDRSYYRAL
jgi:hypothetical protein